MKNKFSALLERYIPAIPKVSPIEYKSYDEARMKQNIRFGTILLLGGFVFELIQAIFTLRLLRDSVYEWLSIKYVVSISLFFFFTFCLGFILLAQNATLKFRYRFFLFTIQYWLISSSIEDALAYTSDYKVADLPMTFLIALFMIFGAFVVKSKEIYIGVFTASILFLSIRFLINCPDMTSAILQFFACVLFISGYEHRYRIQAVQYFQKNEIKRQAEKLEEFSQLKTKLYTNITHELRTPLTIIRGVSENQIEHKQTRDIINRNVNELLRLADQLLQVSKIESNQIVPEFQYVDMIEQTRQTLSGFEGTAFLENNHLYFRSKHESLMVHYDPIMFEHIINNLISNALKFTPKYGSVTVSINAIDEHQISVCVSDTGWGINEDDLSKIFNRYYQGDHALAKAGIGIGVGLSIVKEYVEKLEGEISVSSVKDKGTKFNLRFPFKNKISTNNEFNALKEEFEFNDKKVSSTQISDNLTSNLPKILIVEDNVDMSNYINSCLNQKFKTIIAYDGKEGFEKVIEYAPEAIITDIMMPKLDGIMFSKLLKNDPRTSHIPILVLSAKSSDKERLKSISLGIDAYLTKPFNKEELILRIDQLIKNKEIIKNHFVKHNRKNELVPTIKKAENPFLIQLEHYILEHIEDTRLSAADLHRAVHMSRSQFYKKIKGLSGLSPSEFKRNVQLQRAKQILLENSDLTISEVAHKVGYKHASHFSRDFKKNFNCTPREVS